MQPYDTDGCYCPYALSATSSPASSISATSATTSNYAAIATPPKFQCKIQFILMYTDRHFHIFIYDRTCTDTNE